MVLSRRTRSDIVPDALGSVLGPSQGRSCASPGRSWRARGVPRSSPGRLWRVPGASRVGPDASPKRLLTPKTAQERFFVDFSSFRARFFVDFRPIFRAFSKVGWLAPGNRLSTFVRAILALLWCLSLPKRLTKRKRLSKTRGFHGRPTMGCTRLPARVSRSTPQLPDQRFSRSIRQSTPSIIISSYHHIIILS